MPSNSRQAMSTRCSYSGRKASETIAVLGRARADPAGERAAERLGGAEAGSAGDSVDGERRGLEQPARDLDPHPLDVHRGRAADLGAEHAGEVARAHRGPGREPFDAVVVVGVLADPVLQLAQRIARRELRRELRAELGLTARPLHEQHELARDVAARRHGRDRRRRARARGPSPR